MQQKIGSALIPCTTYIIQGGKLCGFHDFYSTMNVYCCYRESFPVNVNVFPLKCFAASIQYNSDISSMDLSNIHARIRHNVLYIKDKSITTNWL